MRKWYIIALILPVLVPLLLAGKIVFDRSSAPIYLVRIEGFDPRDMLYGHYLRFRFAPEKSARSDDFPDDMEQHLRLLEGRYYVPEAQAYRLDAMLRDEARIMEIEVGLPKKGKAFMGDLYIDGKPMADALRDFEHRVDLDGDPERQ